MSIALSASLLLMWAVPGQGPTAPRDQDLFGNAMPLKHFSFENEDDLDYDRQPDDWTRRRGPGFPHFIEASIDRTVAAVGRSSLCFHANGGGAVYYSPLIRVEPRHAYVLRGKIKSQGITNDAGLISVSLLDHKRRRVKRLVTPAVTGTHVDWVDVRIGPFSLEDDVRFIVLGCHLVTSSHPDFDGKIWFDDLWLGSVPRLTLELEGKKCFLRPDETARVICTTPGLSRYRSARLKLQLLNALDEVVRTHTELIRDAAEDARATSPTGTSRSPEGSATSAPGSKTKPGSNASSNPGDSDPVELDPSEPTDTAPPPVKPAPTLAATGTARGGSSPGTSGTASAIESAAESSVTWDLGEIQHGYFRVRAALELDGRPVLIREISLGVVDSQTQVGGEFGWSFSRLSPSRAAHVVAAFENAGIRWLKLPVWNWADIHRADEQADIIRFLDRLERSSITPVGMLSDPPVQLQAKFAQSWVGMSKVFSLSRDSWYPVLEPLVARYSFRIRHWQLGDDSDISFVGHPGLNQTIESVKREFDRLGLDSHVGLRWKWDEKFNGGLSRRQGFLTFVADASTPPSEIESRLRNEVVRDLPQWVMLKGLPRSKVTTEERVRHLARSVLAAKLGEAEGIFASDPNDPETGLIHDDGGPTELFVPWNVLTNTLRNAKYLGRLELPGRTQTAVFERDKEAIVFLWSDKEQTEEVTLGEQAVQVDLWGRTSPLESTGGQGRKRVRVGPTPLIIRGGHLLLLRWISAVRFQNGRIRSEYGEHEEALVFRNMFPQGVSGKVVLNMPRDWSCEPGRWSFQAAANEEIKLPMTLAFPPDAPLGLLRPTVDFELAADRLYHFTVLLPFQLGMGDVELILNGKRTSEGRLELEQKIINKTNPPETLSFNCSLFVPGQIRQKQLVTKLGLGEDSRYYAVPFSPDLVGKDIWLRAEQIDGRRVLNFRWRVEATK